MAGGVSHCELTPYNGLATGEMFHPLQPCGVIWTSADTLDPRYCNTVEATYYTSWILGTVNENKG